VFVRKVAPTKNCHGFQALLVQVGATFKLENSSVPRQLSLEKQTLLGTFSQGAPTIDSERKGNPSGARQLGAKPPSSLMLRARAPRKQMARRHHRRAHRQRHQDLRAAVMVQPTWS